MAATDLVQGYATARLDQLEARLLHEFEGFNPEIVVEAHAEIAEVRALMQVVKGGDDA